MGAAEGNRQGGRGVVVTGTFHNALFVRLAQLTKLDWPWGRGLWFLDNGITSILIEAVCVTK